MGKKNTQGPCTKECPEAGIGSAFGILPGKLLDLIGVGLLAEGEDGGFLGDVGGGGGDFQSGEAGGSGRDNILGGDAKELLQRGWGSQLRQIAADGGQ